jgi:hypothetical protein
MIKYWLHATTRKFERSFGYDASYLHEIIDISPAASFKFGLFQIMSSHRQHVPSEAFYGARLAATLSEDCGPCSQLIVTAALRDRVRPAVITALLRGDLEQAGPDAELGFRYGIAVSQNTGDTTALVEKVEKRFGKRALVSLAFAVASSRVYPALKRGLGHGAACSKIIVAEETIMLRKAA